MKVQAPLARWVAEPPPPEVCAALERRRRISDVVRIAVMPDVHLADEGADIAGAASEIQHKAIGLEPVQNLLNRLLGG